ncbi:hypothetical protein J2128_000447 [Methanomicrobium sp. W14]|uniref:hypothetical protein n=1 Tax=Methanomicrobium sp. W14 TaxID=2817839 RepID=UPI001AE5CC33|nr:hypothetical protein [Methanomicrobium sp. W14]MBP2132526.1 hypothetical protein [Methanomicrobium sp. W14]
MVSQIKKDDNGYFPVNNLFLAGILSAKIFSDLCTAHKFAVWDENLEVIIETIFDGCDGIGGTDSKRFLLYFFYTFQTAFQGNSR